jgi:hypothetical protein
LNRLLDWENVDFIVTYFATIIDNGVTLADKDVFISFIQGLQAGDTLAAKLQVIAVIMAKLKGNPILREIASAAFAFIEPFIGDGDDPGSLLEAFLVPLSEN